tara:strand:+ start:502 stop:825 length:324 start_codon:yes stop_codon:yes gene_type:complete
MQTITNTLINDNHEAFEYAIALSDWLSHWYGGMSCPKYAAYCKIGYDYKLVNRSSIDYDSNAEYGDKNFDEENETIIMLYKDLTEDNWEYTFDQFCNYMDNSWDNEE